MSAYSLTIVTAEREPAERILCEVMNEAELWPDCITENKKEGTLTLEYETFGPAPDFCILPILEELDKYYFASQNDDLEIFIDDSHSPEEWSACWKVKDNDGIEYIDYIGEPMPDVTEQERRMLSGEEEI